MKKIAGRRPPQCCSGASYRTAQREATSHAAHQDRPVPYDRPGRGPPGDHVAPPAGADRGRHPRLPRRGRDRPRAAGLRCGRRRRRAGRAVAAPRRRGGHLRPGTPRHRRHPPAGGPVPGTGAPPPPAGRPGRQPEPRRDHPPARDGRPAGAGQAVHRPGRGRARHRLRPLPIVPVTPRPVAA